MPFGQDNTLTVSQQFMNNIFSDLFDICVIVYLDNMFQYQNHVKEVLHQLWKAGLERNVSFTLIL